MALERVFEFAACIAAIGEDVPQPGEPEADGFEDIGRAIAILDIGGMDEDEDQKSAGVGEYVPLAALDLLAHVVAGNAAAFRRFDRLAVDHARRSARLPTNLMARCHHQKMVDRCQKTAVPPVVEIAANRRDRRKAR